MRPLPAPAAVTAVATAVLLLSACISPDIANLQVGDCVKDPRRDGRSFMDLESAECTEPDTVEVSNVYTITEYDDYPGEGPVKELAMAKCSWNGQWYLHPTSLSWNMGPGDAGRRIICFR
jgi:hypothetical protein